MVTVIRGSKKISISFLENDDDFDCDRINGLFPEPYLLVVSETRVAVVHLLSNYSTIVANEPNRIKNLIIDPVEEKMYFKSGIKVYRANLDGSNRKVIYQDKVYPIRLFALDWIGRRMFWVYSKKKKSIFTGNLNLSNGLEITESEIRFESLAVDPNTG
ncbi:pro-epidermal growth factor [Paramuricea clavata]|uniref:Pro-epidermal growth factor n=1 Tax=Paramuricea clavata TaxID=317549 RepID=A0A7D9ILJ6_PARCT|nr:pro-epidermal growth factor [Paramuricea clavata]